MSTYRPQDQDVLEKGRKKPLREFDVEQMGGEPAGDDPQQQSQDPSEPKKQSVEVDLREQINQKLYDKLVELNEGHNTVSIWNAANVHRQAWLDRNEWMLKEYDEFLEPIYDSPNTWSSTLHLPTALTVVKTYHARMLAALLAVDPPFTVKARQAANQDRADLVQELMRYTINTWCNHFQGVEETVDAWLWHWIVSGCGILKLRWERNYTRYVDVIEKEEPGDPVFMTDPQTGEQQVVRPPKKVEVEQEVVRETFNGPVFEHVMPEDLVIVNGDGDPQRADDVIHQSFMTASQLWTLADTKVFNLSAVEEVIKSGENRIDSETVNGIKLERAENAGTAAPDKTYDLDRYQILERYAKIDIDGSGINADVILWVHKQTSQILRATYLYRVNPEGTRPFFKIDFHKRYGQDYGVGMIELIYSLTKEIDAIHNMKVDFGLISTMPFGFYRSTSNMSTEKIPFEPGALIPVDNPQTDIFFPQLGNRSGFTGQEEQALQQQIDRFTSISDISLGVIGGQGATRTATGTRALLGESNANLDVFLRRMNRGWKRAIVFLFQMLQQKIPAGFQFRLLGDDGNSYWETVPDRKAIAGMFDFELEANSANSNKQIQIEQANSILQAIANPLFMQTGIVSPLELYSALKTKFQVEGVRDFGRYIKKPNMDRIWSPIEILDAALAGVNIPLNPQEDLQGLLDLIQHFMDTPELLGQFQPAHVALLKKKQIEAQNILSALKAQQAQVANQQQIAMNRGMGTAPQSMPGGPAAPQQPQQQPAAASGAQPTNLLPQ